MRTMIQVLLYEINEVKRIKTQNKITSYKWFIDLEDINEVERIKIYYDIMIYKWFIVSNKLVVTKRIKLYKYIIWKQWFTITFMILMKCKESSSIMILRQSNDSHNNYNINED